MKKNDNDVYEIIIHSYNRRSDCCLQQVTVGLKLTNGSTLS